MEKAEGGMNFKIYKLVLVMVWGTVCFLVGHHLGMERSAHDCVRHYLERCVDTETAEEWDRVD